MATYAERPDGLLDVTLDDGTRVPMAMDVAQAQAAGLTPYADPGFAPPAPQTMTQGLAGPGTEGALVPPAARYTGPVVPPEKLAPSMGGPSTPPATAPAPVAPAIGAPAPAVTQLGRNIVPVGVPPQQAAAAPPDEAQQIAQQVFQEERAPRGGPGRRVPAQDIRAQFEVQKAAPRSEEDEAALAGTRADVAEAKLAGAGRAEQALGVQARLQSEEIKRENDAYRDELQRRAGIEREIQDRRTEIDSRLSRARELDERGTAKERVWQDKGWFGRILASLSLALGHLGTAQGGPNLAKEILDEEVAAEEKRHQDLLESAPERSGLKDTVEVFGNPEMARQELRLRLKEQALAKSQYWATRAAGTDAQQQFDEWIAQLGNEVAAERDALNRQVAGNVAERWQHMPERVVGGYRQKSTLEALEGAAKGATAVRTIRGEGEEEEGRTVPGVGKVYGKAEEGEKMRDIQADYLSDKRAIAELQEMARDPRIKLGMGRRGTPEYHRANALVTQISTRIAKGYGGIITDADRAAAREEFGDPTRFLQGAEQRIAQYQQKLDREFRSKVQTKVKGAPAINPSELSAGTRADKPGSARAR